MIFNPADYQQFARECVESARRAQSDELRKHFLDLAKMWAKAADREGVAIPEVVRDKVD
jgi:hypothetical protein